ncbi:iron-containing alcohol dehydrogenase [Salisediminibacterium selenitireducens]|uniref:Iron-containing alcohol dehydrogenase n=1 Tax=Bacillus selenitireducens (strain ATCC 700615 / DSM 15326 / MLS10) TaxID=439292 RepID=D6XSC5_BACIE|nr:iron-containing alcohol dehydrogenase [Salisediminibacterium selenitireducens]ADH98711.1 iron-containing alcohol dehydrogenase [[Bacillus] selenitireducens MLS10]
MDAFVFQNPVKLIFGNGQTKERLVTELKPFGKKVLLVYGGGSIKNNGIYDEVTALLEEGGFEVTELSGVEPNPRLSTVKRGVEACREQGIDVILAVGGGSVIDCTKAIAAGAKYDGDPWDLVTKKAVPEAALPFGTILTIAATGSEMNAGSVITNWETNEKHGWGSPHTYPAFSILEPKNTLSLPKDQTVYGIVDMMTHVLEQYFHPQTNTPLQEHMCEAVLKTVIEEAPGLVEDLENMEKRETVLYAGTIALNGMLQMGVRGDWASHNIEHAVSAVYDIPHAGGLAIVFPQWLHYHKDQGSTKLKQLAERVWDLDTTGMSEHEIAEASINALSSFWSSLGAPSRLADYEIGDDRLEEIAEKTMVNGPFGNFNKLEKPDVVSILRASL